MKILIGDDHSVVRKGLIQIIKESYPTAEIDEAVDGIDMFKLAIKITYDIIISDISMPGRSGIEFIKELRDTQPATPILILSIHAPEQYAVRSIKAGASGYLNKESAPEELIKAVQQVIKGRKYISPEVADILADFHHKDQKNILHENLSNREFEVMKYIAAGRTLSEIGVILSISVNTVSTYKIRILEKMNMKSPADITRYAMIQKLIE